MQDYIITIGASAGGIEPLSNICQKLPADLPAAVFIVTHIPMNAHTFLPAILTRTCKLSIITPTSGEKILPGKIYIAPANQHMIIEDGIICLQFGPKINHCRPAIDPLFRSAAITYKNKTIGVILSGLLDDGTAGMLAIKKYGGTTIVQDPKEAQFPDMPQNVLKYVSVDHCLGSNAIPDLLIQLINKPPLPTTAYQSDSLNNEVQMDVLLNEHSTVNDGSDESMSKVGSASTFTCPTCHGTLWEIQDSSLLRFRCRVGHAFSLESFSIALEDQVEDALWAALRSLEEKANLSERIAVRAKTKGIGNAIHFSGEAKQAKVNATILKKILTNSQRVNA
jgi:two-component system, chemotaxis family, protein-glutamate methylesterase/glutaminase